MSAITLPTSAPVAPPAPPSALPLYRLSVEQYHDMARHGILESGLAVELLEGLLLWKKRQTVRVTFATQTLSQLFRPMLPDSWFASVKDPVTLGDSEPEPDVSLTQGSARRILLDERRHPGAEETLLVVEVSEATLEFDRQDKGRIYARGGVRQYWIVNLIDRRVEINTEPSGPCDHPSYAHRRDYQPGEQVPVVLDGVEVGRIGVSDLMP